MLAKYETTKLTINFINFINNQYNTSVKILRSDEGGEYHISTLVQFLVHKGICYQVSCPYTPQQNGISECKHCHLLETTRALLHDASLPHILWPHAVLTATYLINRLPFSNTHNLSPYQLLHNTTLEYTHLRVFGRACYPLIPPTTRNKFQPKRTPCVFVGYSPTSKGYLCLNPSTNRIITSHNLSFNEKCFPFKEATPSLSSPSTPFSPLISPPSILLPTTLLPHHIQPPSSSLTTSPVPSPLTSVTTNNSNSAAPTNSTPSSPAPQIPEPTHPAPSHLMVTRTQTGTLKPKCFFDLLHYQSSPDTPTSYLQAIKHPEWRHAMSQEFHALQSQGTWTLVPPPSCQPILGCRWTFCLKLHANDSIARYKTCLVAQGQKQEYGINYTENFSPVAKFPTIKILLTIAISHKWPITQLDVSNAFLHGHLHDTVYMSQPPGF